MREMDPTMAMPQDASPPAPSAPPPAGDEPAATPAAPAQTAPAKPRRGRAVQVPVEAAPRVPPETIGPSVEAILLTSERPVAPQRLAEALGLIPPSDAKGDKAEGGAGGEGGTPRAVVKGATEAVARAIEWLNAEYERTGRSFRVEQVAGGYRLMTLPSFAGVISAFQGSRARSALSHAALETLAIIAYKQPVTRAQLEAIRGVASGEVLRTLIDRRLVTIAGRAEELGRPLLYGTTKQFLETFGLSSIKDLPSVEELRQRGVAAAEKGEE